ncbi:Serine/threonine-protein kinase Nek3 [Bagarius yarrelli]|uniref:Serine/threonine-protein kinase Nek3 n=1 Tax=Bagarius yarrelli TaxID=175774 RepID=A0A556U7D7_BAGYA|nr:Serine/threonine-protein kinase Nek3 [Bagarius yarrelli]
MDRYTVVKVIGEGSFGRALLVQPNTEKVKWVMKEIRLPKAENGMKSARAEAVLLSRMKHQNIVAFRESFEANGHLYIVMEFCSGGDLLQRMRQQNGSLFPEDVILRWFSQMCLGTKHIHDKRVLHRDLKSKFEARSWKSLILKVCRGSYTPLPSHLPYELHYLIKHMLKTNPKDRPSVQTILSSHRVSKLLHKHLIEEELPKRETKELTEKRVNQWKKEEGKEVAMFLGQKSLLNTTTPKDLNTSFSNLSENQSGNIATRKRWAEGPSNTVLQVLRNADIISSGDTPITQGADFTKEGLKESQKRERRKWNKDPPERLLKLLEKAPLNAAFSTYIIHRHHQHDDDDDDVPDGPEEVDTDQSRLEPRSDDDDTDFEEDFHFDWQEELEKMFLH